MSSDNEPPLVLKAFLTLVALMVLIMFGSIISDIIGKSFSKKRWTIEEAREYAQKNKVRELCSIYSFEKFDGKFDCSFYSY